MQQRMLGNTKNHDFDSRRRSDLVLRSQGWIEFAAYHIRPLPIAQQRPGLKLSPAGQGLICFRVVGGVQPGKESRIGNISDRSVGADIGKVAACPLHSIVCVPPGTDIGFQLQQDNMLSDPL